MSTTDARLAALMADEEQANAEYQAALARISELETEVRRIEEDLPVLRAMASGSTRVRAEYVQAIAEGTLDEWETP